MKEPRPHLTSSTIASAPAASFLPMMLAAISGKLGTVPVTSRNAYSSRSAGASVAVCAATTRPTSLNWLRKRAMLSSALHPGMPSSLSIVPPEKLSPRPLIFPTGNPHAAAIGPTVKVVLSPTPPLECLSTTNLPLGARPCRSSVSPLAAIASVNAVASALVIPRK